MSPSVLVLDSNPLMFDQYRSCLSRFSCSLSHARTSEEALRLAEEEDFDLIFAEIDVPGISGFDFKQQLKKSDRTHHLPVIAVCGPADDWTLKRMRSAGFFAFFAKPLCPDRVVPIVASILAPPTVYSIAAGVSI